MLEMPELWDISQGSLLTGYGTRPRDRSVVLSTNLKGVGELKRALTSDMDMQALASSTLLVFSPVFPHYLSFPPFQNDNKIHSVPLSVGSM